jgi:hypothetical protein
MKKVIVILTFCIILVIVHSTWLEAQQYAKASACVTATVIPSVGVEMQKEAQRLNDNNNSKSEIVMKVNDNGKYSLQIINETNKIVLDSKLLDDKNSYRLKNEAQGEKRIVQISVLSS